jgi:hypothetical protein
MRRPTRNLRRQPEADFHGCFFKENSQNPDNGEKHLTESSLQSLLFHKSRFGFVHYGITAESGKRRITKEYPRKQATINHNNNNTIQRTFE